jgi:hypothetical protein
MILAHDFARFGRSKQSDYSEVQEFVLGLVLGEQMGDKIWLKKSKYTENTDSKRKQEKILN